MRIFWVALAVRILYMTLAHTFHVRVAQDHFGFGWEAGRIARALVTGYGYADPFAGHSGPTSWVPPVYPLLLAGIFKIFGIYTAASAWVALAVSCVFSAAIAPAIYEIAARCFGIQQRGRSIALWSAWIWAVYPAALQYAVRWLWDMSITACLFSWVLVIALRARGIGEEPRDGKIRQTTALWAAFGLLWGVIALSNATLLLFLPVCGIWMLLGAGKGRVLITLPKAVLAGLLFLACIAPWMARNWSVFHAFIPMRGNFGAELYSSLLEGNNGFSWGPTVPVYDHAPEYLRYKALGEHAYVMQHGALANEYIRTHRPTFYKLAVKRMYFFWFGIPHTDNPIVQEGFRIFSYAFASLAGLMGLALTVRRRIPASGLFLWAFALIPLTYYFVIAEARFRHPLEPLITILGVFLFQSATRRAKNDLANDTASDTALTESAR